MMTHRRLSAGTVVWVRGEVDTTNSDQLESFLAGVHPRPEEPLLLELSGLCFLDSSGLAVLIRARNQLLAAGGDLHLISPHSRVMRVLEVTGLAAFISVHPDLPHALAAIAFEEGSTLQAPT